MSSRAKIARPPIRDAGDHDHAVSAESPLVLEAVANQSGIEPVILLEKKLLIGSDPECAIRVPLSGVASRHAVIERKRTGLVIKAHSRDVPLNHIPVDQAALHEGDRLAIGSVEFAIRRAKPEELARAMPEPEAPPVAERSVDTAPLSTAAVLMPEVATFVAPEDGAR